MKQDDIFHLLCLLSILLAAPGGATPGEVYFAGDHYKVQGGPDLRAEPVNPSFAPGERSVLRLMLANSGEVEGLVPREDLRGAEEAAALEMLAEFGCVDATKLKATLRSSGDVEVTSGPVYLDTLAAGKAELLEFGLAVGDDAKGTYNMALDLEYEYQIDSSVKGDVPSPLYVPASQSRDVEVRVEGDAVSLEVAGLRSDLSPGVVGVLVLAVRNSGHKVAENCSARLVVAPPFRLEENRVFLGNLSPGEVAVARFDVSVRKDARPESYQMACEIIHAEGRSNLSLTTEVRDPRKEVLLAAPLLIVFLGGAVLAFVRRRRSGRARSLRKRRPLWPFG